MAFATGNQDMTTRVYDIRNTSNAMHVLPSRMGSVSSLKYSNDGQHLIAAESVDFVHIYETAFYESSQVIDMFGDIAGVGLSPDDQTLYIANTDEHMG
jgi:DNA-binding beta-propeller fold protein YncE